MTDFHPSTSEAEIDQAMMIAAVGVAIAAAREVGRPDPGDAELTLGLRGIGFAEPEIRAGLATARSAALVMIRDAAALGALALFLGAACLWLPLLAGA